MVSFEVSRWDLALGLAWERIVTDTTYREWNHRVAGTSYRDMGRKASVTRAAVHIGVKGMGMQTGHQGTYNRPLSRDREQVRVQALQSSQRSISMQYDKNRWENKEGWNPKVPGPPAK